MVEPGQTLGRYKVESVLGAGGMGEVFRAWDTTLRRWVALKVVERDATGRADRLMAEARAVATLKHPNVVSVFDVGEENGLAFVSMDLIVGKNLRDHIGDATVTAERKQAWLLQIAGALGAAHRAGLVHRDVKPENVMIGEDDQAHVLDFGIAKAFGIDVIGPTAHSDEVKAETRHLTGEGRIIGTPAYMAPEQLAGAPPSPSWDQYAFGVTAYELLTGKHPRIAGLIEASGRVKPANEVTPGVPLLLAEVAAQAMAPTPDGRFPSMDEIVFALGGTVSGTMGRVVVSLPPPASASGPRKSSPSDSTSAPQARNVPVHDTLPTAVHPGMKTQSTFPAWGRPALFGVLMLALLGGGIAVGASLNGGGAGPAASNSVQSANVSSSASWVSPPSTTPSAAPTLDASAVPSVSATVTASSSAPIASARPTATVNVPAAKPKLTVRQHASATIQYEPQKIERVTAAVLPLAKACIVDHPPRTFPAVISVKLELWTFADDVGKVRAVDVREPEPLVTCLRDVYMPLAFGPGQHAEFPPGAVFLALEVDAVP
jgi:serine/threonine-protein kinase